MAFTFTPGATARDQARALAGDISNDRPPFLVDAVYDAFLEELGADPATALTQNPYNRVLDLVAARALRLLGGMADRLPVGSTGPQRIAPEPAGESFRREAARLEARAGLTGAVMASAGGSSASSAPITSAFRRPETYGGEASES